MADGRAGLVPLTEADGVSLSSPTLTLEHQLWRTGYDCIAGLDEVGRGAWAGPVVAAAIVLPPPTDALCELLCGVRDSKLLAPAAREKLFPRICAVSRAVGVGMSSARYVDRWGIVAGTQQAMLMAVRNLTIPPSFLLIDGFRLAETPLPQFALSHGDELVLSIASASIVAKVFRDRLMVHLDRYEPGYGFAAHKGYGTPAHRAALGHLGPCPAHRLSFAPLQGLAQGRGSAAPDSSRPGDSSA